MLYDRRKVQRVLRFFALSMRFFALFFACNSHYLTLFVILKLKLDNHSFSRRAHHQFVLNACEVQRFRRLSCFGTRASTFEGCASFPPSLAQAEDTLAEPPKSPRDHDDLPDSLCFVSHVTRVLFRSYGWHMVQKKSFSFGVRKRRETPPIQRFDLKTPQNVRLFDSDMPTAFPRKT